jgi:hypothetical protein
MDENQIKIMMIKLMQIEKLLKEIGKKKLDMKKKTKNVPHFESSAGLTHKQSPPLSPSDIGSSLKMTLNKKAPFLVK